jgi:hypothetical protein
MFSQADIPRTGIVVRTQALLQRLSFDDKALCTVLLIVGGVMTVDCITALIQKYKRITVHTESFGTTTLQKEGLL